MVQRLTFTLLVISLLTFYQNSYTYHLLKGVHPTVLNTEVLNTLSLMMEWYKNSAYLLKSLIYKKKPRRKLQVTNVSDSVIKKSWSSKMKSSMERQFPEVIISNRCHVKPWSLLYLVFFLFCYIKTLNINKDTALCFIMSFQAGDVCMFYIKMDDFYITCRILDISVECI